MFKLLCHTLTNGTAARYRSDEKSPGRGGDHTQKRLGLKDTTPLREAESEDDIEEEANKAEPEEHKLMIQSCFELIHIFHPLGR